MTKYAENDYNSDDIDYDLIIGEKNMSTYQREAEYIRLLVGREHTVKELAEKLFISEPTVRRDIYVLREKEILVSKNGVVRLKVSFSDKRIPLFIREAEQNEEKIRIALHAAREVKDGDVVMLDASTTAYYLLPHLAKLKNIILITNGAKAALEAASLGIKTISTGGEMTPESFSYVGTDAESLLRRYNADVAFFSCRGISDDGRVTDNSILENGMRRIMLANARKSFLLADQSKRGNAYIHTLCYVRELSGVISE